MMNRFPINLVNFLLVISGFFIVILLIIRITFIAYARPKILDINNIPPEDVAIVFGAGLRRDGTPTPVLKDRVQAGVDLYLAGKVKNLLLSGDNRFENYNEPAAMAVYAQELGMPPANILIDNEGKSTFESCWRAKDIFKIKRAVLVTQTFHLPRALYICNQLGIDASGVSADLRKYWLSSIFFWNLREIPAGFAAIIETALNRSETIP